MALERLPKGAVLLLPRSSLLGVSFLDLFLRVSNYVTLSLLQGNVGNTKPLCEDLSVGLEHISYNVPGRCFLKDATLPSFSFNP